MSQRVVDILITAGTKEDGELWGWGWDGDGGWDVDGHGTGREAFVGFSITRT